jgi:hypothetical protein
VAKSDFGGLPSSRLLATLAVKGLNFFDFKMDFVVVIRRKVRLGVVASQDVRCVSLNVERPETGVTREMGVWCPLIRTRHDNIKITESFSRGLCSVMHSVVGLAYVFTSERRTYKNTL